MKASLSAAVTDIRPLLKVPQVAALLGIKQRTVYELAKKRDDSGLPFMFKVGGSLRARPEDVEAWMVNRATSRCQ